MTIQLSFLKCHPLPPNHFLNGCQHLKRTWQGALRTSYQQNLEARQNQASVTHMVSVEWQLCCLGHLLRTEKKIEFEWFHGTSEQSC